MLTFIQRIRQQKLGRILLPLSILLLLTGLHVLSSRADTPDAIVADVWRNTQRAGSYAFDAEITQYTIPVATASNIGKSAERNDIRLVGSADLAHAGLNLTLFSQGGSLLDQASGIEFKLEDGRSFARLPDHEWQEVADFSGSTAPNGDFLTYLAGATEIADLGRETRNGISFTRYAYAIDGKAFAEQMRETLSDQLRASGALAPHANIQPAPLLQGMTGNGELWVDDDGLPVRNIVTLNFPAEDGAWSKTEMTVTFSDFGTRLPLFGKRVGSYFDRIPLPTTQELTTAITALLRFALILSLTLAVAYVLTRRSPSHTVIAPSSLP